MANRYVNIDDVCEALVNGWHTEDKEKENTINEIIDKIITPVIVGVPTANVLELNNDYQIGDICIYGGGNSQSYALVQIEKILEDERGIAELKFIKVFNDNTGNNYFTYLLETGKTMNGSFKYLRNITPRIEEKSND